MAENVVINFEANTQGINKAEQDLKSLGDTAKTANLTANTATDKSTKSFHGLKDAIGGAKGNILILNGAMGLLGDKSAALQTIILKVHSALLLVKGVKSFTGLETSIVGATGATKGFTAALAANPIGAIAVAVTALAAGYAILSQNSEDATSIQDKLNDALEETDRLLAALDSGYALLNQGSINEIALLKANGATRKEIHDKEIVFLDEEIRQANNKLDSAKKLTDVQRDQLLTDVDKLEGQKKVADAVFSRDEAKQAEDDRQKKKAIQDKRIQDRKAALDKLAKLEIDAMQEGDDKERAKLQYNYGKQLDDLGDLLDNKLIKLSEFNKAVTELNGKLASDIANVGRGKEFLPDRKGFDDFQKDLQKANDQIAKDELEKVEENEKKKADIITRIKEELYAGLSQLASDFIANSADEDLRVAEEQKEADLIAIDEKLKANEDARASEKITQREFLDNQKKLIAEKTKAELDGQKKINEAKHKQDVANRAAKLFEIALGTARNVIEQPGIAGTLIPLWLALGGVQAALVAAQPLPKYHKGRLASFSSTEELAVIRKDETILNPATSKEYHPALSAIHKGTIPANAMNNFVRNFRMSDFSGGRSMSSFDYYKNASEIEWQLRGQNKLLQKELRAIRQAIQDGNNNASDLRRA